MKQHGSDPGTRHFSITPGADDLAIVPRAPYIETGGDLVIEDSEGITITYTVSTGQVFPFRATKIKGGTTATVIGWI